MHLGFSYMFKTHDTMFILFNLKLMILTIIVLPIDDFIKEHYPHLM